MNVSTGMEATMGNNVKRQSAIVKTNKLKP